MIRRIGMIMTRVDGAIMGGNYGGEAMEGDMGLTVMELLQPSDILSTFTESKNAIWRSTDPNTRLPVSLMFV